MKNVAAQCHCAKSPKNVENWGKFSVMSLFQIGGQIGFRQEWHV
jgi:hypothetical protein